MVSMPQGLQGLLMRASTTPTFDPPGPLNGPPPGRVRERSEIGEVILARFRTWSTARGSKEELDDVSSSRNGDFHIRERPARWTSPRCKKSMLFSFYVNGPDIQCVGRVAPLIITRRHLARRSSADRVDLPRPTVWNGVDAYVLSGQPAGGGLLLSTNLRRFWPHLPR